MPPPTLLDELLEHLHRPRVQLPLIPEHSLRATLALGVVWSILMLVLILQLPNPSKSLAWASLFFPVYYTCLSFALHARRSTATPALLT